MHAKLSGPGQGERRVCVVSFEHAVDLMKAEGFAPAHGDIYSFNDSKKFLANADIGKHEATFRHTVLKPFDCMYIPQGWIIIESAVNATTVYGFRVPVITTDTITLNSIKMLHQSVIKAKRPEASCLPLAIACESAGAAPVLAIEAPAVAEEI